MSNSLSKDEKVLLTAEQAIAMLADGDYVHTFRNSGGMLLGADLKRADLEREINNADQRELAGGMATSMKHGLVLRPKNAKYQGDLLFVATREAT